VHKLVKQGETASILGLVVNLKWMFPIMRVGFITVVVNVIT